VLAKWASVADGIGGLKRRSGSGLIASCFAVKAQESTCRIEALEILEFKGMCGAESGSHAQYPVQPLHLYDAYRRNEYHDSPTVYLNLMASGGLEGLYGPINREAAIVINQQMSKFLIGKDALAGNVAWDQLWRLNRHGRTGILSMAISAAENALWDLRGPYSKVACLSLARLPLL